MSDRNEFSAGLVAKFAGAFADAGGTPSEMNLMSEHNEVIKQALYTLRGMGVYQRMCMKENDSKKILGLVKSDIIIPDSEGDVKVGNIFREGTIGEADVKIYSVWSDFHNWFGKQVVKRRGTYNLTAYKLLKNSVDGPIIQELGSVFETDVVAVFHLMEQQPKGQKGVLLTNGYANIFYCRDTAGVLRAVRVLWNAAGWHVDAGSVENPGGWSTGCRVFSRK